MARVDGNKGKAEKRIEKLREALKGVVDHLTGFGSAEQSVVISRAKKTAQDALIDDDKSAK